MSWKRKRSAKYYAKRINETSLRGDFVVKSIRALGLRVMYRDSYQIQFVYQNQRINHWIETAWSTGKGIQDCRGLENLLMQLKQ